MNLRELISINDTILSTPNQLFDRLCLIEEYINRNGTNECFDTRESRFGQKKYKSLNNDFATGLIVSYLKTDSFRQTLVEVCRYKKDHQNHSKGIPDNILKGMQFLTLSLDLGFYIVARFSADLTQKNIEFIETVIYKTLKEIEKQISFEFNLLEITEVLQSIIFDSKPYNKTYPIKFDDREFYNNLKKARLIIGNYLVNISSPIALSNSFKKIIKSEKEQAENYDISDPIKILMLDIKKFEFLKNGFSIKSESEDLSSFAFFFSTRESSKIFFLVSEIIIPLEKTYNIKTIFDRIHKSIDNAQKSLENINAYFIKNFSVFNTNPISVEQNQWSNKSFLNTIKFLSVIASIKSSKDIRWKDSIFIRNFHVWINDINENINYFSSLDDWLDISTLIKSTENNSLEFKSTLGFHLEQSGQETPEVINGIKREIENNICKTILAMANSGGGDLFVGIIENPDKVKKPNLIKKIKERNGFHFFDLNESLKMENENFDQKRLKIQNFLQNLTGERMDFLDSLIEYFFIKIFFEEDQSFSEILRIKVKKALQPVFILKEKSFITLPKRLNGRVEMINPKDEVRQVIDRSQNKT